MSHLKDLSTRLALHDLQRIPGIGPRMAQDLLRLGVRSVEDLHRRDPQALYDALIQLDGPTDPCVLYTFRCAVYFADHEANGEPMEPEKLKWWNWKDAR